mmetsp:Transcript_20574/g.30502  ORF Transcript_20574/g.30502 Transcript_20574/m.30502 type:complete len:268 (+) Transcript_20574:66-869(+)
MRRLLSFRALLLLLSFIFFADSASIEGGNTKDGQDDDLVQEIVQAGRGHRDERGERDQWSSTEHLEQTFDSRRPISAQIKSLLQRYKLECLGCNHDQAVKKINAFVKGAKEENIRREKRNAWWSRIINGFLFALMLIASGLVVYYKTDVQEFVTAKSDQGYRIGRGCDDGESRKNQMEKHREKAAKAAEARSAPVKAPPTWRDQEEKEVWAAKQEKQFAKALKSFGGVPAKGRYTLIAEKVEGKSRRECLQHHKLLQVKEKEAEGKE